MPTAITDATFGTDVLKSDIPVLVDFWAPWCSPCKTMLPIVDELSSQYEGKVKVVKMNVDDNMETPSKYNVLSIPTFILFKDGQIADQFIGAKSKEEMTQKLETALK